METKRTSLKILKMALLGLALFIVVIVPVLFAWLWVVIDNDGIFTLTFSPVDVDLDGDLDVLVHNRRNPGEFEVFTSGALWINQGGLQGGQIGRLVYQPNDIEGGLASTSADFDGNIEPDVLVFDGNRLVLGLNQGENLWYEGSFFSKAALIAAPAEQRKKFGPASQYATLTVGDVNQDGRVDALVLGCCGRAFKVNDAGPDLPNFSWIWFNNENVGERVAGNVIALDVLEGVPVRDAALADLDGDDDLDLMAVTASDGSTGLVLWNDGTGRFSDSGQRLEGAGASSLAVGDLDGDGDPDALLGEDTGVSVWINQGGVFAASTNAINAGQTRNVVLADLDNDGDLDALVAGKRRATLWWNRGQAHFVRGTQSFPCSKQQDLTTGDFNGDGLIDIFVARYDKSAQIWFNRGNGGFRTSLP